MLRKSINKKIVLLLLTALFSFNYVSADENDDPKTKPISLDPTNGGDNPDKPKSPSRVRISAYYDGSSIVIASTVAVMADVVIAAATSGACFFSGPAALAPDFRCPVAAAPGSSLIITVTVGSKVYEGVLFL